MGTCGKSIREGIRKNYFVAFFIWGCFDGRWFRVGGASRKSN